MFIVWFKKGSLKRPLTVPSGVCTKLCDLIVWVILGLMLTELRQKPTLGHELGRFGHAYPRIRRELTIPIFKVKAFCNL